MAETACAKALKHERGWDAQGPDHYQRPVWLELSEQAKGNNQMRYLSMWGRWWHVCVLTAAMWIVDGGTEREYGGHAGDKKGEPD